MIANIISSADIACSCHRCCQQPLQNCQRHRYCKIVISRLAATTTDSYLCGRTSYFGSLTITHHLNIALSHLVSIIRKCQQCFCFQYGSNVAVVVAVVAAVVAVVVAVAAVVAVL